MTDPKEFFERINPELRDRVNSQAAGNRDYILSIAGSVLRELLKVDAEALQETPDGEFRDIWVQRDSGTAPASQAGSGCDCHSFMLEYGHVQRKRTERIRLLAPIPEGFDRTDVEAIAEMPDPEEVFVERSVSDHDRPRGVEIIGRYAITRKVSYRYTLEHEVMDLSDDMLELMLKQRVPNELGPLGEILDDIENGTPMAQRRTVQGEGPVVSL
ncbi:MAG TPA: hypothetical protein VK978_01100 [Candidatus Saccharimonadales bacterium]|nr:hypothetical protein [Candidatus Saccharimonadales bacterium]